MIEVEKKIGTLGIIEYLIKGTETLHREDGPALISPYGNKFWYRYGKMHRDVGPAVEWDSGMKEWHRNGKLHREDGPAVIYVDGAVEWWFNDVFFKTKEEWFENLPEYKKKEMLYSEYFIGG
jgi:hypothetical protein